MKRYIILAATLLIAHFSWAKDITPENARKVAESFLKTTHLLDVTDLTGCQGIYLFQRVDGNGFVVVAGDDCSLPILGYSFTENVYRAIDQGNYDSLNWSISPEAHYWMDNYRAQMEQYKGFSDPKAHSQWDQLLSGTTLARAKADTIGPLMTSLWDQSPRYNFFCPARDNGEKSVTGCVATGLSQIMRYWKFPNHGYGSHSYTYENSSFVNDWTFGTIYTRFDSADYKWSKMPDKLTGSSPVNDVKSTAWLCYQVGVAVDMMYSPEGSGAWMMDEYVLWDNHPDLHTESAAENQIPLYFGYKFSDVALRSEYADTTWERLLEEDIKTGHPILYAGWLVIDGGTYFVQDTIGYTGHAFVLDGVTKIDGINYYHVNWGWGGGMNGWFPINALHAQNLTFDDLQGAFLGMEPDHSRLTLTKDFYVHPNGKLSVGQVANIGNEDFDGYIGVKLYNEEDTLWLMNPRQDHIAAGDTVVTGGFSTANSIPSGTYTAVILYGHTTKFMKPICDFDFSNKTTLTVELGMDEPPLQSFKAYTSDGKIIVKGLQPNLGEVEIFDISGRKIGSKSANDTEIEFSVNATGVYAVRVGNHTQKVVVVKHTTIH